MGTFNTPNETSVFKISTEGGVIEGKDALCKNETIMTCFVRSENRNDVITMH